MSEKVCTGCGRVLALAEFVRDRRTSDGHQAVCRTCMSERVLAGKRNGRLDRWDPRPWHRGCSECGEYERNNYPGRKCRHRGAVQGATRLDGPGNRVTFVPEGHELFPSPRRRGPRAADDRRSASHRNGLGGFLLVGWCCPYEQGGT